MNHILYSTLRYLHIFTYPNAPNTLWEGVNRPQKTTPNTVSEAVWSCRDMYLDYLMVYIYNGMKIIHSILNINNGIPRCSMYGIFTYIRVIFRVNVGKYSSTMEHMGTSTDFVLLDQGAGENIGKKKRSLRVGESLLNVHMFTWNILKHWSPKNHFDPGIFGYSESPALCHFLIPKGTWNKQHQRWTSHHWPQEPGCAGSVLVRSLNHWKILKGEACHTCEPTISHFTHTNIMII